MGAAPEAVVEWFDQARYDLGTAKAMLDTGRYVYVVFMCHLAIEKALKGMIQSRTSAAPPRTHNLVALAAAAVPEIDPSRKLSIARLSQASVPTRYPERLEELVAHYGREQVTDILVSTKETIAWLESLL